MRGKLCIRPGARPCALAKSCAPMMLLVLAGTDRTAAERRCGKDRQTLRDPGDIERLVVPVVAPSEVLAVSGRKEAS